jgi:hypothetical protein
MGIWKWVEMDSPMFHPGLPCLTLLRPAGGPPLKRPYGRFRDGLPAERAAPAGGLRPSSTPVDTLHRTSVLQGDSSGWNG